ncbi:G patch domain and ankyrin repeat-containing protein 1 homolog [Manduca sexta]|uniref:G patch domain and ankyrin repeat-containing protein 1 homolog n=1 Tax=Manduca sexta TaxID=7130 RepID=UPI001184641D|nr:G patch domain and ankyrin repeat-containing protein 1 homolog [Manduca sexta]
MSYNKYTNFVRPTSVTTNQNNVKQLSGEEAKKLYLEEIKEPKDPPLVHNNASTKTSHNKTKKHITLSDKDLYLTVQNNDVDTLRQVLDNCPDKINTIDEFGWSLLMIACQANSIDTARELLLRGADISVRDKAGNSARSLVIKNKNYQLADILLSHRTKSPDTIRNDEPKVKLKENYHCETCNKVFADKEEHLSSTIHNINASRGKKPTANFVIPSSNKGYQLMLKDGWDRLSGLGPDGSGKKYPIKTVQKIDRKGLGHEKRKIEDKNEKTVKEKYRNMMGRDYKKNKNFEINFRRQFY